VKLGSLNDLFVDQLKDVYSAERQIIQALPKMAKAASDPQLQQAFQEHLNQTQQQKDRLDQIFQNLGASSGRKKCAGMEGIINEGQELMDNGGAPEVIDAGLIAAAQKVEHYEISAYGTLRTYARMLGNEQVAGMLQQTLDEEAKTDEKLTTLAERGINTQAKR
jgi:ferritin-like metal-binding protein YciE